MKRDIHEQARELIACGGADELGGESNAWLRTHLEDCSTCREYAEATAQLASALHSIPFTAGAGLVQSTQLRVRAHAEQLQQQRERMRLVWMSCSLLALSGAVTTPFLWQGFQWLGEILQVSNPVWQTGFAIFWIAPALAASLFLLARGIHLGNSNSTLTK